MESQEKYEVIKRLAEGHISKQTDSVKIGCTLRNINHLLKKYNSGGKVEFINGNTNRKPSHALSDQQIKDIITIYNNKYWDTNFTHCCELLEKYDFIKISPSCLRKILYKKFILSPRATRSNRKQMNKLLKDLHKAAKTQNEKAMMEVNIISIEDSHSRRPRCAYFGEMLQMDASLPLWFGELKTQLHIAVDDCTGVIIGAYFDYQETLNGYYNVLYQILNEYGIPNMFYTDNRSVFEYKSKKMKDIGKDTFTQFTLQCLYTVNSYIKEYNAKFALPITHNKSVFINQPDLETVHQTLAILTPRVVDNGHCIKFNKKYYKTLDSQGLQVHYYKGTKGLVINTFNKELLFSTNDKVYCLEEIPEHEKTSRNFDFKTTVEKPQNRNIPSAKHPWRSTTFLKHVPYEITDS